MHVLVSLPRSLERRLMLFTAFSCLIPSWPVPSSLRHVAYRDSKLTHLLKDSLGGNVRQALPPCRTLCLWSCVCIIRLPFDGKLIFAPRRDLTSMGFGSVLSGEDVHHCCCVATREVLR